MTDEQSTCFNSDKTEYYKRRLRAINNIVVCAIADYTEYVTKERA